MRKVAVVIIMALLITTAETYSVNLSEANPIATILVPDIAISNPSSSIGGYVNSTVKFEIGVNMFIDSPPLNNISYSLDGKPLVYLENLEVTNTYDYGSDKIDFKTYKANIILEELSEGNHTIVAYANDMSDSTNFIVNSHYQIEVLHVLSPTGQAYVETVPLIFTVNGEIKNAHYYLYRGRELIFDKSVSGNTTVDTLSNGGYDMYFFVTNEYGQTSTRIYFYMVDSSYIENLPMIVGAIILLVFSITVGLLVYFNKRKIS